MHKTEPHLRLSVRNSFSTILLSIQACQSSSSPCSKVVKVLDFRSKCLPYSATWDLQLNLLQHHIALQETDDPTYSGCVGTILLCQHKSVYTLGTATTAGSGPFTKLLADGSQLEYETFNVERAGQATYHGPGQIVLYPILDLNYFDKDIHLYLRSLEQVIINTLQDFEIKSTRVDGLTGVWVDDSKIAAIGIKLRRWVTMHGLSLNVNPDLRYFANIVPCGIADKAVGSIVQYRPKVTLDDAADVLLRQFSKQFQVQCDVLDPAASTAFIELLTDRYSTPKVQ